MINFIKTLQRIIMLVYNFFFFELLPGTLGFALLLRIISIRFSFNNIEVNFFIPMPATFICFLIFVVIISTVALIKACFIIYCIWLKRDTSSWEIKFKGYSILFGLYGIIKTFNEFGISVWCWLINGMIIYERMLRENLVENLFKIDFYVNLSRSVNKYYNIILHLKRKYRGLSFNELHVLLIVGFFCIPMFVHTIGLIIDVFFMKKLYYYYYLSFLLFTPLFFKYTLYLFEVYSKRRMEEFNTFLIIYKYNSDNSLDKITILDFFHDRMEAIMTPSLPRHNYKFSLLNTKIAELYWRDMENRSNENNIIKFEAKVIIDKFVASELKGDLFKMWFLSKYLSTIKDMVFVYFNVIFFLPVAICWVNVLCVQLSFFLN
jgi:hypothetical protein